MEHRWGPNKGATNSNHAKASAAGRWQLRFQHREERVPEPRGREGLATVQSVFLSPCLGSVSPLDCELGESWQPAVLFASVSHCVELGGDLPDVSDDRIKY